MAGNGRLMPIAFGSVERGIGSARSPLLGISFSCTSKHSAKAFEPAARIGPAVTDKPLLGQSGLSPRGVCWHDGA